jgi:hypothetical protein
MTDPSLGDMLIHVFLATCKFKRRKCGFGPFVCGSIYALVYPSDGTFFEQMT